MSRMHGVVLAQALALVVAPATGLSQPIWPDKPITIIVPFPAGGGTDVVVRSLQPALTRHLGQTVVINNVGGAGGTIGSGQAARAAPDGYTAAAVTTSTHAVSASLYKQLSYNPATDFSYIGFIGTSPYILVAHPSLKAHSVAELAQTIRTRGHGALASVGVGTVSHLMGDLFAKDQHLSLIHVPYRGAAPAYTDLIGGQVDMLFDNPVGLAPHVRDGKLVAIATTAATPILPDVPTFAQQGLPDYKQTLWYGLAFPKGTDPDIVNRMNTALNAALADRALAADLAAKGVDARPGTPQDLLRAVEHDIPFWGHVVQATGARLD